MEVVRGGPGGHHPTWRPVLLVDAVSCIISYQDAEAGVAKRSQSRSHGWGRPIPCARRNRSAPEVTGRDSSDGRSFAHKGFAFGRSDIGRVVLARRDTMRTVPVLPYKQAVVGSNPAAPTHNCWSDGHRSVEPTTQLRTSPVSAWPFRHWLRGEIGHGAAAHGQVERGASQLWTTCERSGLVFHHVSPSSATLCILCIVAGGMRNRVHHCRRRRIVRRWRLGVGIEPTCPVRGFASARISSE